MAWPALSPGRLLEASGDGRPRGMTVHDRTRLIGRLPLFVRKPQDWARFGRARVPRSRLEHAGAALKNSERIVTESSGPGFQARTKLY